MWVTYKNQVPINLDNIVTFAPVETNGVYKKPSIVFYPINEKLRTIFWEFKTKEERNQVYYVLLDKLYVLNCSTLFD